ncbi:MAG: hypothetical protein ACLGIR_08450 [Actinomycetes bacterium]
MEIEFIGQPYADEPNLFDYTSDVLGRDDFDTFTAVVAWAKRSGLARIRPHLEAFHGTKRIILGVDEGGATRQGLLLAEELFDEMWIFHEPRGGTFHPKIYLASGAEKASLFIGSNNLTAGGLYSNHEAAVRLDFDLTRTEDVALVDRVEGYIARLIADHDVCKPFTPALLRQLEASRVRLSDEDARGNRGDTDRQGTPPEGGTETVFGESRERRRRDPAPSRGAGGRTGRTSQSRGGGTQTPPSGGPQGTGGGAQTQGATSPSPVKRWSKQLSASDARQPSNPRTNPTGALRLGTAGHDIDRNTWFRSELFGGAVWQSTRDSRNNPIEQATVDFEVTVMGTSHGTIPMVVDHGLHRIAGQNNVPTILHWGPQMSAILDATNYTGKVVTLELTSAGTYRLSITQAVPTPAAIP